MITAVVTGARGFIGRNLLVRLRERGGINVVGVTREDSYDELRAKVSDADIVYHLAGCNRPTYVEEFYETNDRFTGQLITALNAQQRPPAMVLASSVQAALENDYGISKRAAERRVEEYSRATGARGIIYRLPNVFGKWSRPNYNSAIATFCHNIARDRPIDIHDPDRTLRLVHVDDVVTAFLSHLDGVDIGVQRPEVTPIYEATVGSIAELLNEFQGIRKTLRLPDLRDRFARLLHATFVAFLPDDDLLYGLPERSDERGRLAELLKSDCFGQIFVSTTKPGVTRGNHYHHRKVEKFCVLQGTGVIRLRPLGSGELVSYRVSGAAFTVVDIPPGYTHSIENVGDSDMVVLFWANEVFDPDQPDTRPMQVKE